MSRNAAAERALARKYGPAAWETMHNWGKVRNRLAEVVYQRKQRWWMRIAVVVPAVVGSAAASLLVVALR